LACGRAVPNFEAVTRSATERLRDLLTSHLAKGHDTSRRLGRLRTDIGNTAQEEPKPTLPIALVARRLSPVVVLLTVLFEVGRKIQYRLMKDAPLTEQKRDEQATHTPVAVEKRMDGLELGMGEPNLDQERQRVFRVQEASSSSRACGTIAAAGART
jgi:hypothetical protein